jgi:hypothetical protein
MWSNLFRVSSWPNAKATFGRGPPDLDLLCILEALVDGESFDAGAGFFSVEEAMDDHNY